MQQIYYCPQCGGNVQYGIVRCPSCGCPLYWQPTAPAQDPENLAAVEKPALSLIDRIKEALWLTPPPQTARQSSGQYAVRPQTPAGNQQEQYQTQPGKYAGGQNRAVKKDVLVAYLCWLCLGSHYIYLGKTRTQVIFWLTLGGCGLWWIIDGFNLSGMVKDYNIDQLLGNVLQTRAEQNVREPKDIKVEKRSPGGPAEFK